MNEVIKALRDAAQAEMEFQSKVYGDDARVLWLAACQVISICDNAAKALEEAVK